MKKQRHLKSVEVLDDDEQITIEDGIREGIKAGRLSPEIGRECLEAYRRTSHGLTVVPEEKPQAGWTNGVVTLRDPVESGWDRNPEPPDLVA